MNQSDSLKCFLDGSIVSGSTLVLLLVTHHQKTIFSIKYTGTSILSATVKRLILLCLFPKHWNDKIWRHYRWMELRTFIQIENPKTHSSLNCVHLRNAFGIFINANLHALRSSSKTTGVSWSPHPPELLKAWNKVGSSNASAKAIWYRSSNMYTWVAQSPLRVFLFTRNGLRFHILDE